MRILAIDINLVELRELDVEVGGTELVNLLNRPRRLLPELIAGEVKDLQTLAAVLLI